MINIRSNRNVIIMMIVVVGLLSSLSMDQAFAAKNTILVHVTFFISGKHAAGATCVITDYLGNTYTATTGNGGSAHFALSDTLKGTTVSVTCTKGTLSGTDSTITLTSHTTKVRLDI